MPCTHRLARSRQQDTCHLCGFDLRGGSDQRIVRRWDITTSKHNKTLTTTVECTRLTASLYADRMTQRGECHLVSITPNVKADSTANQ